MGGLSRAKGDAEAMRRLALGLSGVRAGIGAMALLAPRFGSKLFGFPDAHDNATARVIGRLFAVREMALGAYTLQQVQRSVDQPELYLVNAAVDAGDAAVSLLTLLGRKGTDRAVLGIAALALPYTAGWLWLRGASPAA